MKIKIESHERFGQVRVTDDGRIVAVDLARILGFANANAFAHKHSQKVDKSYEPVRALNSTNVAKTMLVNRQGAASIVDASANVDAEEIKAWVLSIMSEEPEPSNLPQVLVPQVFNHRQFGNLRVVNINGEVWFVGKDVAEGLGYTNPQKALREHVDERDKRGEQIFTPGGVQNTVLLNKSGLYSLILDSQLPLAKEYRHWVTSNVLPQVAEKGYFSVKPIEPPAIAAVDFTALVERMDNLELLVQTLIDSLAQAKVISEKELSKADRADKLLQVADRLPDSPDRQKLLLHAANLINGKKIF